jgi:hypothetical protein
MRTLIVGVMLGAALIGSAGPASADKPVRGCPDDFQLFTKAQILEKFPSAESSFASFDKNGDDKVCGKQLKPIFNPIDNVAHN